MDRWVRRLRAAVGHDLLMLNSCAVWIEDGSGNVLLQRRSANEQLWAFPGGIMNLGESAAEAAVRETKEETGLEIRIVCLIGIYSKYFRTLENGDQCQTVSFFFRGEIQSGELAIDSKETFDLKYFARGSIPDLFCEQHRDMLEDGLTGSTGFLR